MIDIRSREEYTRNHVPGAVGVAKEDLLRFPERLSGETVQVSCPGGGRSPRAVDTTNTAGAVSVAEGTSAWRESGHAPEGGADA